MRCMLLSSGAHRTLPEVIFKKSLWGQYIIVFAAADVAAAGGFWQ